jgi:hypothetical protein
VADPTDDFDVVKIAHRTPSDTGRVERTPRVNVDSTASTFRRSPPASHPLNQMERMFALTPDGERSFSGAFWCAR